MAIVTVTVAQYLTDIGNNGPYNAADTVTIADTGANLAGLTFSALAGNHVDTLNATDDVLSITVAQINALGVVTLTAGDAVTIADAQATLQGLSGATFGNYI